MTGGSVDLPWSSVQVHPDTMGNHGGSHVDICVCSLFLALVNVL